MLVPTPANTIPLQTVLAVSESSRAYADKWLQLAAEHGIAFSAGPSGLGKSAILHQLILPAAQARYNGHPMAFFMPDDAPQGFYGSLCHALGLPLPASEDFTEEGLHQYFDSQPLPPVLVIDGMDQIFRQPLDVATRAIQFLWKLSQAKKAIVLAALRKPFACSVSSMIPDAPAEIFLSRKPLDQQGLQSLAEESVQLVSPELQKFNPGAFRRVTESIASQLEAAPYSIGFLTPFLETWAQHLACRPNIHADDLEEGWLRSDRLVTIISHHAEAKLTALKPRLRRQLEPLLEILVTWDQDLVPQVQEAAYSSVEALGEDAVELVDVLVYERILCLAGQTVEGATITFVHPQLISNWARLKKCLREKTQDKQIRRTLETHANHWAANGRRQEDQWLSSEALLVAESLLREKDDSLSPTTREFLKTFDQAPPAKAKKRVLGKRLLKSSSIVLALFLLTNRSLHTLDAEDATTEANAAQETNASRLDDSVEPLIPSDVPGIKPSGEMDLGT